MTTNAIPFRWIWSRITNQLSCDPEVWKVSKSCVSPLPHDVFRKWRWRPRFSFSRRVVSTRYLMLAVPCYLNWGWTFWGTSRGGGVQLTQQVDSRSAWTRQLSTVLSFKTQVKCCRTLSVVLTFDQRASAHPASNSWKITQVCWRVLCFRHVLWSWTVVQLGSAHHDCARSTTFSCGWAGELADASWWESKINTW